MSNIRMKKKEQNTVEEPNRGKYLTSLTESSNRNKLVISFFKCVIYCAVSVK